MAGKVAITSQIMAAKTRPNGTIHSLFMTTSCDSVLAHQGAGVSPNLLGLRRPELVVSRRRRPGHDRALAVQCVREKPDLRHRIADAVQVPLEQGWTEPCAGSTVSP